MLFKAIFTNSSGILLSRVLGFARDLLMASILGANVYSDIFFVVFKLPNLFRRIFAEGAFTQAFIPAYAKSKHKVRFSTLIFSQFMAFLLILSMIVSLFAHLATKAIAIGFDDATIDLAAPLLAINFYYLPLIFIVTFLAALLQYKNHFATTAFSTALLNVAMIGALLISNGMEKYDIVYFLSYGVLVGGALQVLVHVIALKKKNLFKAFSFKAKTLKHDAQNSKFYKKFIPAVFGSSTSHLSAFLDTWLASFLITGSISYLYYANRVFQLPLALFAIATSIALFPMVAKQIKNNKEHLALQHLRKAFYVLLGLLGMATLIGLVFSSQIVWLLFERGAFTTEDTANTSLVLSMYLIGLLPYGLSKIFSLWLYAHEQQITAAKIAAKSLGANIVFSLILIIPYEAAGLALASTLSGFILFYLTIKEFGYNKFLQLLQPRK